MRGFHHYARQRNAPHRKRFPFDINVAEKSVTQELAAARGVPQAIRTLLHFSESPQVPAACRRNCGAACCVAFRNRYATTNGACRRCGRSSAAWFTQNGCQLDCSHAQLSPFVRVTGNNGFLTKSSLTKRLHAQFVVVRQFSHW